MFSHKLCHFLLRNCFTLVAVHQRKQASILWRWGPAKRIPEEVHRLSSVQLTSIVSVVLGPHFGNKLRPLILGLIVICLMLRFVATIPMLCTERTSQAWAFIVLEQLHDAEAAATTMTSDFLFEESIAILDSKVGGTFNIDSDSHSLTAIICENHGTALSSEQHLVLNITSQGFWLLLSTFLNELGISHRSWLHRHRHTIPSRSKCLLISEHENVVATRFDVYEIIIHNSNKLEPSQLESQLLRWSVFTFISPVAESIVAHISTGVTNSIDLLSVLGVWLSVVVSQVGVSYALCVLFQRVGQNFFTHACIEALEVKLGFASNSDKYVVIGRIKRDTRIPAGVNDQTISTRVNERSMYQQTVEEVWHGVFARRPNNFISVLINQNQREGTRLKLIVTASRSIIS